MNWSELYLICFGVGTLWSIASLLLGGWHVGHAHATHGHSHSHTSGSANSLGSWLGTLLTPGCAAVFLAWFGGIGYLLTRHSVLGRWADLAIAIFVGTAGALLLASFLRWLLKHEKPLEVMDTEIIGRLGRVSCTIRASGVGEMIFVRDESRRAVPACSEEGDEIARDEEVVVTRYEKGIAYVRTWAALTQPDADVGRRENSSKGDLYVE